MHADNREARRTFKIRGNTGHLAGPFWGPEIDGGGEPRGSPSEVMFSVRVKPELVV